MKNVNILAMSGLVLLFSVNLYGCSNEQAGMGLEQNLTVDNGGHQYILSKDAESGASGSIITSESCSNRFLDRIVIADLTNGTSGCNGTHFWR